MSIELIRKLGLTHEQAEHWVAAVLAEGRALRLYDRFLFPSGESGLAAARTVHAAWGRWADVGDELCDLLHPFLSKGRHVNGAADLRYATGRARAMLTITPDSHLESLAETLRGDTTPIEALRPDRYPEREARADSSR